MPDYLYLQNDLIEACENDSTEFLDYTPKMINRAEERMTRDLDDYGLVTHTSIAITGGNNEVTLPTGTRIVKNLNAVIGGSKINLLLRTDEFLNDYWPVSASTGNPTYYAKLNGTTVRVAPTPASTVDGEIAYIARPTSLTTATDTNYFTDFCYDALFYACMVEAMMFTKNFTVLNVFEERYKGAIEALRNQARRTRRDDLQKPANPSGGDNTLMGAN